MALTNVAYGSDQALTLQSAGLFASCMQRPTTLNRLAGKMPQQAQAESDLRFQSKGTYPIVRVKDLQRMAGDNVTFDLIYPMGGKPIMGSNYAEGRGYAMKFDQDSCKINQTRYPISAGDTMSQQRTVHQLRSLARNQGYNYMARLDDQKLMVHLAGARGFHEGGEWVVPLASDSDFATIMVNTVRAPSNNRHFLSTGSSIESFNANGAEVGIQSTDVMNTTVIDAVRTWLDGTHFPPPPVVFEGDQMAQDAPIRVLLVSSEQYTSIVQSTNFRSLQATAMSRAAAAKNNPIFMGEAGLWNGILIVKMPKPIRFYAGNAINWCASATSSTETTTDLVPAAFGTDYAVDRALLLGGQAVVQAFGNYRTTDGKKMNGPYFMSEKSLDHGDKLEILLGAIDGISKIRFTFDHGDQEEPTDFGVVAIDTAVRLLNGV